MRSSDTIVAISSAPSTPATPAARMIVRLSGPDALRLVSVLLPLPLREGVRAVAADVQKCGAANNAADVAAGASLCQLTIDGFDISGWLYRFVAPRSYTGDDLIELHLPGNSLLAQLAIDQLIGAGGRQAEPGEFTARAYLNGRIDLTAAEGVALAVSATQADELRAARQLMSGELARRLQPHLQSLVETLALIETGIDFSDQDVTFIDPPELRRRAMAISHDLQSLLNDSPRIERLRHCPTFVLMGRPNAGKSTLLNALSRGRRAIVSPVAGTTRDALSAEVALRRGMVDVIDVAGLDSAAETAGDASIDAQMQAHAQRAIAAADFAIHLVAADDVAGPVPRAADLTALNKIDLAAAAMPGAIGISAQRGDGLAALRDAMDRLAFGKDAAAARTALTARHRSALSTAIGRLQAAAAAAEIAELAAADLRSALNALGEVLGQVTPDDVLGRVFAAFCIGK